MLISKQYTTGDVVTFKMVNGDEVVAKVTEESSTEFRVSKPTTVMPSQQGIGLMQSLFTASLEQEIIISKSHVMMHSLTVDEIKNHYIQTTTGIQPVTGGSGIVI